MTVIKSNIEFKSTAQLPFKIQNIHSHNFCLFRRFELGSICIFIYFGRVVYIQWGLSTDAVSIHSVFLMANLVGGELFCDVQPEGTLNKLNWFLKKLDYF